jgi:hypothetical protein
MKSVLSILLLLLFAHTGGFAQSQIFITIENQDCISCLGSLHSIDSLDSSLKPMIVFQRRYRRDSAALVKRLHLGKHSSHILWSDSLFNLFQNKGLVRSAVTLYNPQSGQILKTGLVQFGKNIRFLNAINQPLDTIRLDSELFGGEANFGNTKDYFFNFNGVSKQMEVFDKVTASYLYTLSMNDSLVKSAFRLRFGDKWQGPYQRIQEFTSKWQTVDPQAYGFYQCNDDVIYLMAQHRYLINSETDTSDKTTSVFQTLSKYKNGKLVHFSIVENYLDVLMRDEDGGIVRITRDGKPVQDKKARYTLAGEFLMHNDDLYVQVLGGLSEGIPNHFLARYSFDPKDNTYKFNSLYDRSLPEQYNTVGYNFTNPPSRLPYCFPYTALSLSDELFSLDKNFSDLKLNIFDKNNKNSNKTLWDIKVTADHVCILYLNGKDNSYRYLKYDLKKKEITTDQVVCNYKSPEFITSPMIDDFDYDYVYLPITENVIVRKKMTN